MARALCPSCGAAYNGKKCRQCYYENFGETIAHGNHTHKGEPLVIEGPVRKPIKQKSPFECEKKQRRQHPIVRFAVLLIMIYSLLPMVRNWGLELKAIETRSVAAIKPEPLMEPEETVILHQEQDISIFAGLEDFVDFRDGLCLYVEYTGELPYVTVVMGDVKVNGCDMPASTLVCKARSGEIGKGWLELDGRELKTVSIDTAETLDFTLTALGSNGRLLFTTAPFRLIAGDGV